MGNKSSLLKIDFNLFQWGFNMKRTLLEYSAMKRLDDCIRMQYEDEIVAKIMNDKDKYHNDIQEMIEHFISDLGVADFARMYETITDKRID